MSCPYSRFTWRPGLPQIACSLAATAARCGTPGIQPRSSQGWNTWLPVPRPTPHWPDLGCRDGRNHQRSHAPSRACIPSSLLSLPSRCRWPGCPDRRRAFRPGRARRRLPSPEVHRGQALMGHAGGMAAACGIFQPAEVTVPEKRKVGSSILPLTTRFGLVSSALTSANAGWAFSWLQPSSDHDCLCVTVVGRSLSHADRSSASRGRVRRVRRVPSPPPAGGGSGCTPYR